MYQLNLVLTQEQFDAVTSLLDEVAVSTWSQFLEKGPNAGLWEFQALFDEAKPNLQALSKIIGEVPALTPVPNKNWLKECYKAFPPVIIGKFVIYSDLDPRIPTDKIPIKIEAATAFGTGRHGTTNGCLKAWDELNNTPSSVLDVGCGSGILSLAYAKQTGKAVDAVDIDPESVRMTLYNARENHLESLIHSWVSNGYSTVTKNYDLIFCNILAEPLIQFAPDLYAHLNQNGYAIISGFLTEQAQEVLDVHTKLALQIIKTYSWDGWGTAVLYKP